MSSATPRVTGYEVGVQVDGCTWGGARETRKFAPPGASVSGGEVQAVFRARRNALATHAAILRKYPDALVTICELTTADPEEDTRDMSEFILDDDGVSVAPWMMEARAKRSPRAKELLAEDTERRLPWNASRAK